MGRPQRIRGGWLDRVVHRVQGVAGLVAWDDPHAAVAAIPAMIHGIPAPQSAAERLILRGLLIECAIRVGDGLHARLHDRRDRRCSYDRDAMTSELLSGESGADPRVGITRWSRAYLAALHDAHPPNVARAFAQDVTTHPDRPLDLPGRLRRLNTSPRALRRALKEMFGLSPIAFLALARVAASIQLLEMHNVGDVARKVGYRSKKDFYRAFRAHLQMTPAAFNDLPLRDRQSLVASMRARLQHGRAR